MKIRTLKQTELHRFIVGALATAGASTAGAATVQITFLNNYVANTANGGLTNFNLDFTGGGANAGDGLVLVASESFAGINSPDGWVGRAWYSGSSNYAAVGTDVRSNPADLSIARVSGVIPYAFNDTRINGGRSTTGILDITAVSGRGGQFVYLNRLIFDDANEAAPTGVTFGGAAYPEWNAVSAVPEASSSLALLALGAGGLLTRRRMQRTVLAENSRDGDLAVAASAPLPQHSRGSQLATRDRPAAPAEIRSGDLAVASSSSVR